MDPNLGLLHNKVAYPCNKGANSLTLYNVCRGLGIHGEKNLGEA